MTEQKKKLLQAKIAAALYTENGRVPTKDEIEKWTKFAKGSLHGSFRVTL
jgi:hypothetical protein